MSVQIKFSYLFSLTKIASTIGCTNINLLFSIFVTIFFAFCKSDKKYTPANNNPKITSSESFPFAKDTALARNMFVTRQELEELCQISNDQQQRRKKDFVRRVILTGGRTFVVAGDHRCSGNTYTIPPEINDEDTVASSTWPEMEEIILIDSNNKRVLTKIIHKKDLISKLEDKLKNYGYISDCHFENYDLDTKSFEFAIYVQVPSGDFNEQRVALSLKTNGSFVLDSDETEERTFSQKNSFKKN